MRTRGWASVAACALAVAIAGCGGCKKQKPLEFTVTFKDAKGIAPGQSVRRSGVDIGTVQEVKLTETGIVAVRVSIAPGHEQHVYREAEYIIEKRGGVIEPTGEKQIVVNDRTVEQKTPVQPGDVLEGTEGLAGKVKNRLVDWGKWAGKQTGELVEGIKGWASSPEGQRFQESLKQFAEQAKDMTAERWERFKAEDYPKLRKQASELREKLERDGNSKEARELKEAFERFTERVLKGGKPPAEEEK